MEMLLMMTKDVVEVDEGGEAENKKDDDGVVEEGDESDEDVMHVTTNRIDCVSFNKGFGSNRARGDEDGGDQADNGILLCLLLRAYCCDYCCAYCCAY